MKRNVSLPTLLLTACFLPLAGLPAATEAVFQQNANGQLLSTDSCGSNHFASNNNLWTQSAATAPDCHNQSVITDVSNWNISNFPNGADFNATIGLSAHLNESVAIGNLTINGGGALAYDANNSAGGGAHAVTFSLSGGTITNNGTLTSVGPQEAGQTYQFNADTLLTGSGTTQFNYGTVLNGPGTLTVDTNQKLISGGNARFNTSLVNRGVINADGSTAFFDHRELTFANPRITNTGTIRTTGGGSIQFLASTLVDNTGGILSASGDFAFQLGSGVSINGGTLVSTGDRPSADFFQITGATLNGVNIAAGTEISVGSANGNGGSVTLNGAITNSGQVTFFGNFNGVPPLNIANNTTVSGVGHLHVLGDGNVLQGATLTLGAGQTLDAGFINFTGAVVNHGLINGFSDRGLTITGGDYVNDGTIQSSGGGLVTITSDAVRGYTINNTGGTIQAIDSSHVFFQGLNKVRNGILTATGTSDIRSNGDLTLENVTLNGPLFPVRNCGGAISLSLSGSLTNNGRIDDFQGECNPLSLHLLGDVAINGTGVMVFFRSTTIDSSGNGVLTNGAGHTIGAGDNTTIEASVVNNGVIGSGGGNQFNLNGASVTNNGTLSAGDSSTFQQAGNSVLTNYDAATQTLTGGTYRAETNARLNLNIGPIVTNNAHVILANSGLFDPINSLHENRGTFEVLAGRIFSSAPPASSRRPASTSDAPGASAASLINVGKIGLDEKSSIRVNGDYAQGSISTLSVQVGGNSPSATFFPLAVSGTANLAGSLNVSLTNGFTPAADQTFQIISASGINGRFSSVYGADVTYTSTGVFIHPNGQPIPATSAQLLNLATRLRVLPGDNVLIGGFIITGTESKRVIIRATGPSLASFFSDFLADPTLELYQGTTLLASNDNWKDTDQAAIEATGLAPKADLESAIIRTLAPGAYTAIVRGKSGTTGIGLVEAYDLNPAAQATLGNIATRGFVDTDDNVMIGGFIVGGSGAANVSVVVRAIGPSLKPFGIDNALADPTLELRDGNGALLAGNDNWKDTQQAEIEATGLAPTQDSESTVVASLPNGNYTAIVRGKGNTTGVGLVEVYDVH